MFLITKHNKDIIENGMNKFILMRKQLHLMFNQICNMYIILEIFKGRENLLLKDIYFSLNDIYDILFGDFRDYLEEKLKSFAIHFQNCQKCLKTVQKCYACEEQDLFWWDIFGSVICPQCKTIFHRNCFNELSCPSCLQASRRY